MRSKILEQAIHDCLNEMYQKSQPSTTWDDIVKKYESGEYDENTKIYEHHYLSQEEYEEIEEKYIRAYRIHNEWEQDAQLMIDYLQLGGTKDKWIPEHTDKDGFTHPGYRGYEKTPKLEDALKEIINNPEIEKQVLNKVFELMNNCKDFYCPNREENYFRFSMMNYSPCSNKESVQKHHTETIYDREFCPVDEEWKSVTPETIKFWEEELESWNNSETTNGFKDWITQELTKLITKYKN